MIMTPLDKCFMLDINSHLDQHLMKKIYEAGYSRIPIYEGTKDNIIGLLMARDLLMFNPEDQVITLRHIQSILIRELLYIEHDITLQPILQHFNNDNSHMGIITKIVEEEGKDPIFQKIGIITREDIVEEMLMEEIEDEREYEELQEARKKNK